MNQGQRALFLSITTGQGHNATAKAVKAYLETKGVQCRILDILGEKSSDAQRQQEREARYRQRVLDSFFEYGRLKAIPAQRKKERICLEEIAKELELGRPYPERELNQVLLRFHQDYCTLRRDMISEGILRREEGLYTRLV